MVTEYEDKNSKAAFPKLNDIEVEDKNISKDCSPKAFPNNFDYYSNRHNRCSYFVSKVKQQQRQKLLTEKGEREKKPRALTT
jgi:hypothetical protein